MVCPERELLATELRLAVKRWTGLEDKATAAIGNADPDSNEYLAQAQQARAAAKKARTALDDHMVFHRCGLVVPKAAGKND